MNNAAGSNVGKIPLTVFGGAVTEMAPSDLPEGASPFNQDCDFLPGSVFTRAGRQNVVAFSNLFAEDLAGVAQSLPGSFAPNESPWTTPTNATRNIPGTYASTSIQSGAAGIASFAFNVQQQNVATSISVGMVNTAGNFLIAIYHPQASLTSQTIADTIGNTWVQLHRFSDPFTSAATLVYYVAKCKGGANTITGTTPIQNGQTIAVYELSGIVGLNPIDQTNSGALISNGTLNATTTTTVNTGTANTLALALYYGEKAGSGAITYTAGTVGLPGPWTAGNQQTGQNNSGPGQSCIFAETQLVPNSGTTVQGTATTQTGQNVDCFIVTLKLAGTGIQSQILQATNFNFNISTLAAITGLEVEVSGNQGPLSPDAVLTATLVLPDGTKSPRSIALQLPAVDGQSVAGTVTEGWSVPLTAALLNNPGFGVQLVATASGGEFASFAVYAVKLKAFVTPSPPQNFNYVKNYEQQTSGVFTLALDAAGVLWQEDATNNPGNFASIYTAINPGSFAKSVTFENTEYIAFSDLLQGTDMPRQWTGSNLDRISRSGPAAAPAFATTSTGGTVRSIVQNSPYLLTQSANNWLLVSAGPGAHGTFGTPATPGNVMTIVLKSTDVPPAYFKAGTNIQISGFPTINGNVVNNDPTGVTNPAYYTITTVGTAIPGEQSYDWITVQVPFTTFFSAQTPGGCSIQSTLATLTMSAQVPYLEVGNQFTLTGVTPAGWNNVFTVLQTPNAAVLQISQTSLTGNVATYVYTLASGTAPVVGQYINVNGTLNGNGIFNVVNAVITSVSANAFSLSIQSPNINPAAESNANGSIYGTIFVFDPAGTVTNPIIGTAGATGTIATTGVIGIGVRKAVCMFQTRNGAITAPSPFAQFNITATAGAISATAIPIGGPDVVRRYIAFTGANGGNYFYISQPVTVTSNGQQITYGATVINDNVTTQATFSFPDALLLASTAIDVQGNNLFAQLELPSCRGFLTYADRLIAWGVNTTIFNMLGLSFDGGIGVQNLQQLATQPAVTSYPLGWTIDSTNGAGGSLLVSPLFGNSYYVKNTSGITKTLYGMLTQPAYVTQIGTPIVLPATTYSARVTARCPSGVQTGNLIVDFFSPVLNQIFGSFSIPLSSMTSNFQIFTGTLLTNSFGTSSGVPKDLLFRVYLANVPNNGDVELDRVEPFITTQPTFATQFFASYAFNQEGFDGVTGLFGPAQNQQRANGGMVIDDTLYMLKETSWYKTSDNGVTEPYKWNWRTVSEKVGTIGIHSYDYGESWAISACRAGLYFFEGGEPVKISQEIQTLWDLINWKFGPTIWVKNDEATKTIKIGVPLPTPNIYCPEFPVNANPTTPNVVLNLSYRELNTGAALATVGPIRSTFSGRLMSPEPARKWSFWNLKAPYADMIDRGSNSKTMLYCTGYQDSKIFQLNPAQLHDDGLAINSFYLTHGFPKPEIAEARGIDILRSQFDYMEALVTGSGTLNTMIYPEDPGNLPYILDALPLDALSQGSNELNVNLTGNYYYIRMGTNAVGAAFKLSTIIGMFSKDPWAPVRGTAKGKL